MIEVRVEKTDGSLIMHRFFNTDSSDLALLRMSDYVELEQLNYSAEIKIRACSTHVIERLALDLSHFNHLTYDSLRAQR